MQTMNTHKWLSGVLSALSLILLAMVLPIISDSQLRTSIPAGQSRTMLANGKWLLIGGMSDSGPVAPAVVLDPNTKDIEPLSGSLIHDRSWHSATLLPDGKVLIVGGLDKDGHVIADPEIFDPEQQSFEPAPSSGLSARAYHSATLLTDGTVLLAGGVSENDPSLRSADLWDFTTRTGRKLAAEMMPLGRRSIAKLLSDGSVLLSERVDRGGIKAQVYAPWLQSFLPSYAQAPDPVVSAVEGSVPENRGADVPVNAVIGIRFSKRLRAESLNTATVTLSDGAKHIDTRIVPAEQGMLVFMTPTAPLALATLYMVAIDGARDEGGSLLPYSLLTFTTANGSALSGENTTITDRQAQSLSPLTVAAVVTPKAAATDPAQSKSIKSSLDCLNAELPKLRNNATIADSVPACIPPKGVCQFTVTMSQESQQPACTIPVAGVAGGVKFPRVILDCPGEVANKRFRPSYGLCPTKKAPNGSLDLDHVEIGEDNTPITLFVDRDKNKGDMFMGDIFVDRTKPFKPIPYNNVASLGTGIGDGFTINCNQGCHKPTVPAAAKGLLQPFKPIDPFGDFKGTDLAKSVIFTDIADKKVYPGLENAPANAKKDFQNVCTAISNNKQKITQANTDPKVDLATVNVVDKLCTNLFSKVK
jgi:hypothetical protein